MKVSCVERAHVEKTTSYRQMIMMKLGTQKQVEKKYSLDNRKGRI